MSEWIDFPIYSLAHQQVGDCPLPSCDPTHLEGMMLELEKLASLVFWVISLPSHSHPWSGLLTFSFCFKMCSKSQESERKLCKFILHYWIERHHGENMSIFHPIKWKLSWGWGRGGRLVWKMLKLIGKIGIYKYPQKFWKIRIFWQF